jgi:hypothetical protein
MKRIIQKKVSPMSEIELKDVNPTLGERIVIAVDEDGTVYKLHRDRKCRWSWISLGHANLTYYPMPNSDVEEEIRSMLIDGLAVYYCDEPLKDLLEILKDPKAFAI